MIGVITPMKASNRYETCLMPISNALTGLREPKMAEIEAMYVSNVRRAVSLQTLYGT